MELVKHVKPVILIYLKSLLGGASHKQCYFMTGFCIKQLLILYYDCLACEECEFWPWVSGWIWPMVELKLSSGQWLCAYMYLSAWCLHVCHVKSVGLGVFSLGKIKGRRSPVIWKIRLVFSSQFFFPKKNNTNNKEGLEEMDSCIRYCYQLPFTAKLEDS